MDTQEVTMRKAFEANRQSSVERSLDGNVERQETAGVLSHMRQWFGAQAAAVILACSAMGACEMKDYKEPREGNIESVENQSGPLFGEINVLTKSDGVRVLGNSPMATRMYFELYSPDGKLLETFSEDIKPGIFSIQKTFKTVVKNSTLEIIDENQTGFEYPIHQGGIPEMPEMPAFASDDMDDGEEEA